MKKYKFKATIEKGPGGGAYILFPYDVEKEFGTKGRVPVKATIDGAPYSGSLMKYGDPQHMLGVLKEIRQRIGKGPGDSVEIELWKDAEERKVDVPDALRRAMKSEGVLPIFEKLSYSHQREYCRWIADAKKEETRTKRAQKAAEMLHRGVETPDAPGAKQG
jgi:bifunctional DNA-binding transcriptional regulator/antitoxin component of YhaV-PrlF toxin-antitoxin module